MLADLCQVVLASARLLASPEPTVPYARARAEWLFDPETVVSRNDVLYTSPSPEPWEAMPTGGGDLSAMVRWDGALHLHLTKSDCWGFQAPPDAPPGTRFFNTVSPGHVRLSFGPSAQAAAERRFRQRLDLYHGRVVIEIGEGEAQAQLVAWGHPELCVLVIEVHDPAGVLRPVCVELSEWRETMRLGHSDGTLWAREVHERPGRPHLANTGMDEYYPRDRDPLRGRGTAVMIESPELGPVECRASATSATMALPDSAPPEYHLLVAAAVTSHGEPLTQARGQLEAARSIPLDDLRGEHQGWWRHYWGRSFLRMTSPDGAADWLTAAYHVHLYTLACTNRGPVPAKWDGGAGLMVRDQRTWGICEWVQEIRFTFLPLYAANRLEMARGLCDFYSAMAPYLRAETERMWDLPGLWVPETVTPWGHAEDFVLREDAGQVLADYFWAWEPEREPYGRFHHYNPYVGFLFTSGLEVCQHYLTYYRYSGDEHFLRERAYPVLRGVCAFVTSLLREGDDRRYHLDPANALETWWLVRDPSDTLDGLRAILPEFVELSKRYDADHGLSERCQNVLAKLPDPPRALWREDGTVDPGEDAYAPAAAKGRVPDRVNAENPQLYRVFPFGLCRAGSADHETTRRTFERRICVLLHGWSLDAIWASRLGLREEACALMAQHARRFNRFRYGGWDSNDSTVYPNGLAAAPFLDAAGLSAYGLQDVLVQSHGGVIRVAPAVGRAWSGIFRLRAEGGFLVAADVLEGTVRFVELKSLLGRDCTVANPWAGECAVSRRGQQVLRTQDDMLTFETERGATYLLECVARPLATWRPAPVRDERNDRPGLPGRDT